MLWQGSPGWWSLARSLHIRPVIGYFALLMVWVCVQRAVHAPATLLLSMIRFGALSSVAVGLLAAYALMVARTTSYTFTNRRLVLQAGIALPISYNIPWERVASASLRASADESGNIAVALLPGERMHLVLLWPHGRAGRLGAEPLLRAVPNVATVGRLMQRLLTASAASDAAAVVAMPAADTRPVAAPASGLVTA